MSARSDLLKSMAAAYALDRAIPCSHDDQLNPALTGLDGPARVLAAIARYAVSHPHAPESNEIRESYDLLAKLLAAPRLMQPGTE